MGKFGKEWGQRGQKLAKCTLTSQLSFALDGRYARELSTAEHRRWLEQVDGVARLSGPYQMWGATGPVRILLSLALCAAPGPED